MAALFRKRPGADATESPSLRRRLASGAQAHLVANILRVVVQIGLVAVLLPVWGVQLYGEWLILAAIPTYLALSDLGLFTAAASDMTMAAARGERDHARDVFQAVSRGVGVVFGIFVITLPVVVAIVPVVSWLHFESMNEATAGTVVVMLALRALLISYAGLLYGGFAAEGRYGEGVMAMIGITFIEFVALIGAAIAGTGPVVGAAAMLVCRAAGDGAMYAAMRRRAPWLRLGKPSGRPQVLKRLAGPGLASAAIGTGLALNIQGMVILVGVVAGPASAAIFSTLRTMTRAVIQLLASISGIVAPELAKAYGENDVALLRTLHRRASQTAVWAGAPLLGGLAIFGGTVVDVWTQGEITTAGWLLYLFLIGAAVDTLWFTSGSILVWTNRHQRVAAVYIAASLASIALAYAGLEAWGLNGAASALVALEVLMVVVVLRESLPTAHDTLGGWAAALVRPPTWALGAFRVQIAHMRGS